MKAHELKDAIIQNIKVELGNYDENGFHITNENEKKLNNIFNNLNILFDYQYNIIEKEVKPCNDTSSRVYLPKQYEGKKVIIITDGEDIFLDDDLL